MDGSEQPTGRVAVVIPTYNERANIETTAGRIRRAVPDADMLVVDDNSPDGTGEIADKDRKSTRLNSSHIQKSRMPSSA